MTAPSLPSWFVNSTLFRKLFLLRKLFLSKTKDTHHSQFGEDIVITRLLDMNQPGFFVDVGCYHPVKHSNTWRLYKLGWRGVNIDLDSIKVEAFNIRRKGDINIVAAVSDVEQEVEHFSFGFYSLISSIDSALSNVQKKTGKVCAVKKIKTRTLSHILDATPYANKHIDLLTVDVEGHDLQVLRSLDYERYQPRLIMAELHELCYSKVKENGIYQFLVSKDYELVNWTGPTLKFMHKSFN